MCCHQYYRSFCFNKIKAVWTLRQTAALMIVISFSACLLIILNENNDKQTATMPVDSNNTTLLLTDEKQGFNLLSENSTSSGYLLISEELCTLGIYCKLEQQTFVCFNFKNLESFSYRTDELTPTAARPPL